MTPDQRLEYELSLSVERDLSAALDTSFEDGMEKGLKEGIEKGKAEGLCQVAANLKRMGMDIATIVNSTGLSKEVILSL